jgi:hypothetical protein
MISNVGHIMQQLAKQSQQQINTRLSVESSSWRSYNNFETNNEKADNANLINDDDDDMLFDLLTDDIPLSSTTDHTVPNLTSLSTASLSTSTSTNMLADQREYEMRRMWDAWCEQIQWYRTMIQMEQSTNVSRKAMIDYYKQNIYPNRYTLLQALRDSMKDSTSSSLSQRNEKSSTSSIFIDHERVLLRKTPLASVLLSNILIAAPLLKNDIKI